mgnify:CR=1 FL=1
MVTAPGYGPVPASPDRLDDLEAEAYKAGGAGGQWPDLTDPATLGCLLALVRVAWGDQTISARFDDEYGWWVVDGNRRAECARGEAEAEALVAALEAAGGEE